MKKQVIIIGGGASGLTAGIQAARQGADVTILEHKDRVGKKILSTGNGKCNLTNLLQLPQCYRSNCPQFPMKVINCFTVEETLAFFKELGIVPKIKNGYVYPNSGQASAVLEVLRMETEVQNIAVVCDCKISQILVTPKGAHRFCVKTSKGGFDADALILAAGSKAAPVTGSDGSGYQLARQLGHHVIKPLPALVQLRCDGTFYKQLAGIRIDSCLELLVNGNSVVKEAGELQLTDYGISGIPVFQISRFAAKAVDENKDVKVMIDFLPDLSIEESLQLLDQRKNQMKKRSAEEFFIGLFPKKLGNVLLKRSGIATDIRIEQIKEQKWKQLINHIKRFETQVIGTNPFVNAQICCGGVDTREINPETLESKIVKELYLVGELLDVDGICGGYNLQWAWSTGSIAGKYAGRGRNDKN